MFNIKFPKQTTYYSDLFSPNILGVLVDITQNYSSAFFSCAGGMGLGAVFLALVRPAKTVRLCKSRDNGRNSPVVQQETKDMTEEFQEVDIPTDPKIKS